MHCCNCCCDVTVYCVVCRRRPLQYKVMLRDEQHEREKEHNDHGVMIRELQTLVASERHDKEQCESQARQRYRLHCTQILIIATCSYDVLIPLQGLLMNMLLHLVFIF